MSATLPSGRCLALARALDDLLDNDAIGADEIAVFVALARHTDEHGECFPSQSTLAKRLDRSRPWVNARIARLCELEIVEKRRHRLEKGGETSCRYHLPSLDVVRNPVRPFAVIEGRGHPGDNPCPMEVTPCQADDTNRDSHQPSTHQPTEPDRTDAVIDLEVEQLVRRVQQASAGPWRLENARRAVTAAVGRAGVEAVREAAQGIHGAGLRAWEITARLERLTGAQTTQPMVPMSKQDNQAQPSRVVQLAVKLMRNASADKRFHWHKAACTAGSTAPGAQLEQWVPVIAEAFLQSDHSRDWERLHA